MFIGTSNWKDAEIRICTLLQWCAVFPLRIEKVKKNINISRDIILGMLIEMRPNIFARMFCNFQKIKLKNFWMRMEIWHPLEFWNRNGYVSFITMKFQEYSSMPMIFETPGEFVSTKDYGELHFDKEEKIF